MGHFDLPLLCIIKRWGISIFKLVHHSFIRYCFSPKFPGITMRKFLSFLLSFPFILHAQSDFLKDPDIVWAAEIEQDWVVETRDLYLEMDEGIKTLKLLCTTKNQDYFLSPYLPVLIFKAAISGKLPIFKDPKCQIPAVYNSDCIQRDTVWRFDPVTYDPIKLVEENKVDPSIHIKCWRLRQVLCYHKKSASWTTRVQSVAPMVTEYNEKYDSIGLRPVFWFKANDERQALSSSSIVWAKEIKGNSLDKMVQIDQCKPIKVKPGFENPISDLYQKFKTDSNIAFYDISNTKVISMEARNLLITQMDTVILRNDFDITEKIPLIKFDPSFAQQLCLSQTWYWNESQNRLSVCLNYVIPIRTVLDSNGTYKTFKRLFAIRPKVP